jgi:hypothetical protein
VENVHRFFSVLMVVVFPIVVVHAEVHQVAEHHRAERYGQHPAASQSHGREEEDQQQRQAATDHHHQYVFHGFIGGARISAAFISFRMRAAEALPTAAATGLVVRLGLVRRRQEFIPAVLAAKVEGFSIAFGVKGGGGIHGHSADEVFGFGFRRIHDAVSFVLFLVVANDSRPLWWRFT